jgi:predicted heme/steroid binding protein
MASHSSVLRLSNTTLPVIAWSSLATHRSRGDCWLALHGSVYDVTAFLPNHPGGSDVLLSCAGGDASSVFDQQHSISVLERLPSACRVGIMDPADAPGNKHSHPSAAAAAAAASAGCAGAAAAATAPLPPLTLPSALPAQQSRARRVRLPVDVEYAARLPGRIRYASVMERVLSLRDCEAFIAKAETKGFTDAMFGGQAIYDLRKSAKVKIEDADFAGLIFERCRAHLPPSWTDERGHRCMCVCVCVCV